MVKLGFTDFWGDFDENNNFFVELFKSIIPDIQISTPQESDILLFSCYSTNHKNYSIKDKIKIFYTGENVRPNFDDCNYALSFDFDDHDGRNIRLPLWLIYIDWFDKGGYKNPEYVTPFLQLEINEMITKPKTKFCATVFSNPRPERIEMYHTLSRYKQVDGYGRPFGNWTYGELGKLQTLSDYKFSICFENTIHAGYYTEKPLHAKIAGTIPIYYADKEFSRDFNQYAFINLSNYKSINDLVEYVKKVDESRDLTDFYQAQQPFNYTSYPVDLFNEVKEKLKDRLKI